MHPGKGPGFAINSRPQRKFNAAMVVGSDPSLSAALYKSGYIIHVAWTLDSCLH